MKLREGREACIAPRKGRQSMARKAFTNQGFFVRALTPLTNKVCIHMCAYTFQKTAKGKADGHLSFAIDQVARKKAKRERAREKR